MTKRLIRTLAAGALALLVLTGCAEIPSDSAVKQGPDIQNLLSGDYLYYSPSGPVDGLSKADVLAGFLNASTGPQNDFGIAREYLTPDFRTKWTPSQKVYIQRGSQKVRFGSKGDATVSIGVAATVDASGHYALRPSGTKQQLNFTMKQVKGQWRIDSAPNAVVMIRPVFDVIFHSYPVYFFDHSYNYLVPDLRWFPARASTATRLVAAALAGPTPWLQTAVVATMPTGTQLAIDSVTVEKSTAIVNLNTKALQATRLQKQRFKAQLVATLAAVSNVTNVEIRIANSPQSIDDFSPASSSTGAYAPVVLESNQLLQLTGPSSTRLPNASDWVRRFGASDFAVTSDQTGVALVSKAGVYLGRLDQPSTDPKLVDHRSGLLPPRFDRRGQLWLTGSDGNIQLVPPTGKSKWLALAAAKGKSLKAIAVSPEGARIAMLVADAKGALRLEICAIARDRFGVVTGFGAPIQLDYGVGTPRTIEWSSGSGIMVLADVNKTQSNLTLLTIGGDPREVASITPSRNVMISDNGANIYILDNQNQVQQFHGYNWSLLASDVLAAHMVN